MRQILVWAPDAAPCATHGREINALGEILTSLPKFASHLFSRFSAGLLLSLMITSCGGTSQPNGGPPPSFSLSPTPSSVTVQQGSNGSVTINVAPANGFSGTVALAASGLPSGVTATFNSTSATSSTLTLSATSSAATGLANVTVTGTSGNAHANTAVALTISGFSLSVSPSALSIQQGASATSTVTVNASGFSGNVALSASGLPTGVTATFNPTSTTTTSALSVTVNGTASAGTSTITITGTSGSLASSAPISLTVLVAPPPGSLPRSFFGLNNVDPTDDPTADGMLYGTVGHPIRLAWPYIETSRGVFDFSFYDQYTAIAPKEGPGGTVAVMVLTLGMTPGWAVANQTAALCRTLSGGVIGCQGPPDQLQDWKDFITALVNHYNGVSASHIKYYEIWNEWNVVDAQNGFWSGTPVQLATLQSTACAIIHATDGDTFSMVVTPSTVGPAATPNDQAPTDLQTYFNFGGSNCPGAPNNLIDAVSFHGNLALMSISPYPLPGEGCAQSGCNGSIVQMANSYREVLNFSGPLNVPLLDTEGGFESADIPDIDQRAAWLAQFYALQAGLFNSDQLQMSSWFTWGWASSPGVPGQIETSNKSPDQAGVAYNQVFTWLFGRFPVVCAQTGKVWTCPLTGSSGYQALITWDDSQTCSNGTCTTSSQTAPSWAVKMRDLAGNTTSITGGSSVPVGLKPIILESQ